MKNTKKNKLLLIFIALSLMILTSTKVLSVTNLKIQDPNSLDIIADVVEKVGNAVVNIDVVKMQKTNFFNPFSEMNKDFGFGFELDPKFKDFFEERIVPLKGAGSGFIINKEGYILTNQHVIHAADKIKVTLKDGRTFDAKAVGQDKTLDIAVIKIEAHDLPTINLGDSSKLRPGEWVIAIGNPYGFSNTVTSGIISALGRDLKDLEKKDLIQTDAAINPGNSGGPLLNLKGEVVGINVAIVAQAQGICFAVPINEAKEILQDLIIKGKVIRPWLGIYMRDVDQKIATYLDLPIASGVIVIDIAKDSPAEKMGLKKYDIIKQVNSQKTEKSEEVQKIVSALKPGNEIKFAIFRNGNNYNLKGLLGEKPQTE